MAQTQGAGHGLVHLISKLTESYFDNHSLASDPILRMLAFGFDDQRPWIGKVTWDKKRKIVWEVDWAEVDTLATVGQDVLFEQRANKLRKRIQKHRADIRDVEKGAESENSLFNLDRSLAHHDIADKKAIEEGMLREIESKFVTGIGGILQRLELGIYERKVVAGFTRDDRSYLDGANYSVSPDMLLGPVPIVEKMGRQIRNYVG